MKHDGEIMEILAAYDLTGSLRATAALAGAHTTLSLNMSRPVTPAGRWPPRFHEAGLPMRSCP